MLKISFSFFVTFFYPAKRRQIQRIGANTGCPTKSATSLSQCSVKHLKAGTSSKLDCFVGSFATVDLCTQKVVHSEFCLTFAVGLNIVLFFVPLFDLKFENVFTKQNRIAKGTNSFKE
ncbi:hypothetical protein NPIL_633051 [Nephila pilipes]|uniref:Uncharacterized protein n=1 Tax=Nephila pilipes TaxID=299642 RepID=A0A8X6Q7G4_NEPPI|nr:hypothetical protein NPIL_633051 [Nephila pilipes]